MSDEISSYPFAISQDVLWRDMDAFQHVNNATYFRYFEDVRQALFDKLGMIEFMSAERIGPILAHTQCDFRAPLIWPDRIRIGTYIKELKPKRFTMSYIVFSEKLQRVAAEGEGVLVYYDYAQEHSCEIPGKFVNELEALHSRSAE